MSTEEWKSGLAVTTHAPLPTPETGILFQELADCSPMNRQFTQAISFIRYKFSVCNNLGTRIKSNEHFSRFVKEVAPTTTFPNPEPRERE